jgi:DNA polymerase delta subunit 3
MVAKTVVEKPKSSEKGKAPDKTKQVEKKTDTLDWRNANTKGEKGGQLATTKSPKEAVKTESKSGLKVKGEQSKPDNSKLKKQPMEAKTNTTSAVEFEKPKVSEVLSLAVLTSSICLKRGTKRPSAIMSLSDSEDDNPPKIKPRISTSPPPSRPSSLANGVKVKRGVLLSDDEEESPQRVKQKAATNQKGKGRVSVAHEEEEEEEDISVKAMTALDDCVSFHPLFYTQFYKTLTLL